MRRRAVFVVLVLAALLPFGDAAEARMPCQVSVEGNVGASLLGDPITVHGKVVSIGAEVVRVKVERVFHGTVEGGELSVRLVKRPDCFGGGIDIFSPDEEVLLFCWRKETGPHELVDGWHGKRRVPKDGEKRKELFTAVEKLYELCEQKDEDTSIRSYLALTDSPNPHLREAAHRFVRCELGRSELRERFAAEVLRMMESDKTFLIAACAGARFEAEEVFDVVVRACGDEDEDRRRSAAFALRNAPPARSVRVIPVLLEVLRAGDEVEQTALATLDDLDERTDSRGAALLEAQVPLFVRLCRREWIGALYGVDLLDRRKAPVARETLVWAAKSHPLDYVRDRAKVLLEK